MYKNKTILCVIPARAGSKRLPNKNIKILLGKPLIAWTIQQARSSKYIDKIIVSTDSKKIATVAGKYKAIAPFLRPAKLAGSKSKMIVVLEHAINFFRKRGEYYDLIVLLQPTSPLRSVRDIDEGIKLLLKKKS